MLQRSQFGPHMAQIGTPKAPQGPKPAEMPGKTGQLPMFLPTEDVINRVHKIDSRFFNEENADTGKGTTPRHQWELEGSGIHPDDHDGPEEHTSLKALKLSDVDSRGDYGSDMYSAAEQDKLPPARIYQNEVGTKILADGHHRLAVHEELGHELMPVMWRQNKQWGESRRMREPRAIFR